MRPQLGPTLAVILGDAYGVQFEYRKGNWAHLNIATGYTQHPTHQDIAPGQYSDDGQMTLAVAEQIIAPLFVKEAPRLPTTEAFDKAFIHAYVRDRRAGYSRGMLAALKTAITEDRTLSDVCAAHGKSQKSGAAMRATPIGLLPDINDVRCIARRQGFVTHKGEALLAAEATALASHYMHYQLGPREDLLKFLAKETGHNIFLTPWTSPVGSPGMESARAAFTAITEATSLSDLLIRCCAFTGDVDTVCAIAMGCAYRYADLPDDLPASLFEGLENGPFGRDYCAHTDYYLMHLQRFGVAA